MSLRVYRANASDAQVILERSTAELRHPGEGGSKSLQLFRQDRCGGFLIIKRYFLSKSLQQLGAFGFESHPLRHIALILLSYFESNEPNPRVDLDMATKRPRTGATKARRRPKRHQGIQNAKRPFWAKCAVRR